MYIAPIVPLKGLPVLKIKIINPIKKVDVPERMPRDTPKETGSIFPNAMIITLCFIITNSIINHYPSHGKWFNRWDKLKIYIH